MSRKGEFLCRSLYSTKVLSQSDERAIILSVDSDTDCLTHSGQKSQVRETSNLDLTCYNYTFRTLQIPKKTEGRGVRLG